jgi:hypothetical protein
MHCSSNLLFEDIIKMSDKEWYPKVYRHYRKNILYREEKKLFQITQDDAKKYEEAYIYMKEQKLIVTNRWVDDQWGWMGHWVTEEYYEPLTESQIHANRCIQEFGKGWKGFNFETCRFEDNTEKKLNDYDNNIFSCPVFKCNGYVQDSVCGLCNNSICSDCREQKFVSHVCNPDIVKSIQQIFKSSHSCPKCYIPISKIEGCDQMFCIECKTTFSWNTGRIVNDNEFHHNPHYLDWIAEKRKNEAF